MSNKPSTIKERVLILAEQQTISKTKFFTQLGQSYSSFTGRDKKSAVPSDFLSRLLAKYPQCNPNWLLTGKGEMAVSTLTDNSNYINELELENKKLKKIITELESKINQ